jgi:hypothetical protein
VDDYTLSIKEELLTLDLRTMTPMDALWKLNELREDCGEEMSEKTYFCPKLKISMSELPIQQPFTNLQLELLSLYARNVSDEELLQIRDMLARFFADRATKRANEVWQEKGLDEKEILKKHRRTPHRQNPA